MMRKRRTSRLASATGAVAIALGLIGMPAFADELNDDATIAEPEVVSLELPQSGGEEIEEAEDPSVDVDAEADSAAEDLGIAPMAVELDEEAGETVEINLLNINDFHGRIQGKLNEAGDALTESETMQFAGTIEELRSVFPADASLFLSAGDNVGASLYASAIEGDKPTIEVMNLLGLAATATGNHEFDKGWLDLQLRIQELFDGKVLGANVYYKGTNNPALPEYDILNASGLKVAVIGVVTEGTPTYVSPDSVAELDFGDPVDAVNRVVGTLNALPETERPDLIVAEYHEGADDGQDEGATLESEMAKSAVFAKIVSQTSADVDVIFTGHTHRTYAWDAPVPGDESRTRPVVQTGSYGQGIGQVVLTVDATDGTVVSYVASVAPLTGVSMSDLMATYPDPLNAVYDVILRAEQNAREKGSVVVGKLTAPITRAYTDMELVDGVFEKTDASSEDRGEASALATLVGNALLSALSGLENAPQFGILNPGGLRTDFYPNEEGEVTMAQAKSILPFDNELTIVTMTGEQLVNILEEQWQRTLDGNIPPRAFLQLGLSDNVQYTYSVVADPEHEGAQLGIVTSVMIDGVPVEPEGTYRAGTFSFLSAGGDNFHTFTETSVMETGYLDWEGWVAYLETSLEGEPIAPDFARQGVELEGLTSGTLTAGEEVTVKMSRTNVFSVGSPANTEVAGSLAPEARARALPSSVDIGTADVTDGSTELTFVVPDNIVGDSLFQADFTPAGAQVRYPVTVESAVDTVPVNLMNINDFHGRIQGTLNEAGDALTSSETIEFAGTIEMLRSFFPADASLFLSAGDNVGASLYASSILQDVPTIEVLNELGLAATAAGNHEFDKGWLDLQDRIADLLDGPVLGANVYKKGTTEPVLPEYVILEASGLKVAVIGVVTEETPTLVTPSNVAMLDFGDPVDAVNRVVGTLNALPESERPDLIIAEYHEGAADDQSDDVTLESEMAASPVFAKIVKETSPDVDVIFNGHTHRTYAWDGPVPGDEGRTRPVVQTGSYGAGIGQVVLNVNPTDGTVVSYVAEVVPITNESMESLMATYPDPLDAIYEIVLAAEQNAREQGSVVVGKLTAPITRAYTNMELVDGVFEKTEASAEDRGEASAMGTLVGNALKASLADLPDAPDFGILNPGGLRTDFYPNADGEITMSQAMSVLPFNNELTIVTMTGQQLIDILSEQWQRTLDGEIPGRAYLQLGLSDNVLYTYSVVADPDHDEGQLGIITSVMIDGVPVDPAATYRAGTFSFLSAGGDNFHTFKDTDVMETGRLDWEGWVAYLETSLEGEPIAPDFARQGVELEGLTSGELTVGEEVTVTMSRTNVFSVGSPANTTADSWLVSAGLRAMHMGLATTDVVDGSTTVTFTVPEVSLGEGTFGADFAPAGTQVRYPVLIKAADEGGEGGEGGEGEGGEKPGTGEGGQKPGTGAGQKPGTKPGGTLPTTGFAVLGALLAATALGGTGVALKSRRRQ